MSAPHNIMDATSDTFADDAAGFLGALFEVWPECPGLRAANEKLIATVMSSHDGVKRMARRTVITHFHNVMSPYYTRVRANDGSVFIEVSTEGLLASFDMATKWRDPEIDDDTRATIFEWVQRMCDSAEMYSFYDKVPSGMLSHLTGMAADLTASCARGGDTSSITPDVIEGIVGGISEEDMQAFAQVMIKEPSSVQAIMGIVGRLSNTDSDVDVTGIMSMAQTMMGGGTASAGGGAQLQGLFAMAQAMGASGASGACGSSAADVGTTLAALVAKKL